MKWTDFRNLTDREITLLKRDDESRSVGFTDVCRLAMKKNAKHPLHAESRDVCAAHLFKTVARGQLRNAAWLVITNRDLGMPSDEYKALVRKAYSSGSGVVHKGLRLFFY